MAQRDAPVADPDSRSCDERSDLGWTPTGRRRRQAVDRLAAPKWPTGDLVFATPGGTMVDPANFAKTISRLCIKAGLGHRDPHQLRHSAATIMLAQGVPLHVVSDVLGHSSISVTKDVYGHVEPEHL